MNLQDAREILRLEQQVATLQNQVNLLISYLDRDESLSNYAVALEEQRNAAGSAKPVEEETKPEETDETDDEPGEDLDESDDTGGDEEFDMGDGEEDDDEDEEELPEIKPKTQSPPPPSLPEKPKKKSMAKRIEEKMLGKRPLKKAYKV